MFDMQRLVRSLIGKSFILQLKTTGFYDKLFFVIKNKEFVMRKEVRASHILVKTREEADKLREEIISGEKSFEDAAKHISLCPSGHEEGDLGFFKRGVMVKPFEDAAFELKEIGDISAPVETQFGWHLIKLTGFVDE